MSPRRVLLFSSGLDSFMLWRLLDEPQALYVALGHRYQRTELVTLDVLQHAVSTRLSRTLTLHADDRLRLGDFERDDAHIPYRNLHLATVAAHYGDHIYLGALRGEYSRDKHARFFRDTSRHLSYIAGRAVRVTAPARHLTKTGLVARYLERFPAERADRVFLETRSCYDIASRDPIVAGCGRCMACFRRWVALENNGVTELYANAPWEWDGWRPRGDWWALARRTPRSAWPGIVANDLDALRALRARGMV